MSDSPVLITNGPVTFYNNLKYLMSIVEEQLESLVMIRFVCIRHRTALNCIVNVISCFLFRWNAKVRPLNILKPHHHFTDTVQLVLNLLPQQGNEGKLEPVAFDLGMSWGPALIHIWVAQFTRLPHLWSFQPVAL